MTTTTADKGEQECREAFEQTFKDYYVKHGFISSKEEAFAFYQAAWNRRPTNEGQDGLTDVSIVIHAAVLIQQYIDWMYREKPDLECHPYIPEMETCVEELHAIARHLSSKKSK